MNVYKQPFVCNLSGFHRWKLCERCTNDVTTFYQDCAGQHTPFPFITKLLKGLKEHCHSDLGTNKWFQSGSHACESCYDVKFFIKTQLQISSKSSQYHRFICLCVSVAGKTVVAEHIASKNVTGTLGFVSFVNYFSLILLGLLPQLHCKILL